MFFWATDDVNVLYPREEIPKEALLFVAPAIQQAGNKYVYTNKWRLNDMKRSIIRLPAASSGKPDWEYMETAMGSLLKKQENKINILSPLGMIPMQER